MKYLLVVLLAGCSVPIPAGTDWPDRSIPSWAADTRFAVTVNLGDTLAFVGVDPYHAVHYGDEPVGDVPVELEGPHHIAGSPDRNFLYVNLSNYVPGTGSGPHGSHGTGTVPGSLLKLDSRNAAPRGEVLVDRNPGDVVLSKDGTRAYVSHYDLLRLQTQLTTGAAPETGWSGVAVVDTDNMVRLALTMICPTAHGMGLSPDGKTLYVTCTLSDELAVMDVSTDEPKLLSKIPVGPAPGAVGNPVYMPYALTVAPDGTVWVSDNGSGDVRVYSPALGAMDPTKVYAVGGVAMFGAFTNAGATYWVPHQGDDKVTKIDVATGAMTVIDLPKDGCLNAHALVPTPDEKAAIVVCEGDHRVIPGTALFLDLTADLVGGAVQVGMFPDGAAWLPPQN